MVDPLRGCSQITESPSPTLISCDGLLYFKGIRSIIAHARGLFSPPLVREQWRNRT